MIRDKETYALVIAGAVLLGVAAAILGTINGVGVEPLATAALGFGGFGYGGVGRGGEGRRHRRRHRNGRGSHGRTACDGRCGEDVAGDENDETRAARRQAKLKARLNHVAALVERKLGLDEDQRLAWQAVVTEAETALDTVLEKSPLTREELRSAPDRLDDWQVSTGEVAVALERLKPVFGRFYVTLAPRQQALLDLAVNRSRRFH